MTTYFNIRCRIMERVSNESRVDEQLKNEFILQQLVHLIAVLDLSDEVNRWIEC